MHTIDWRIILLIVNSLILLFLIYNLGRYTFCKKINYLFLSIRFKTKYFLIGTYSHGLSYVGPNLQRHEDICFFITSNGFGFCQLKIFSKAVFLPFKSITGFDIVLRNKESPMDEDNLPIFIGSLGYILIEYVFNNKIQPELITIHFDPNDKPYNFNNYLHPKFNPLKEIKKYMTDKLIVSYYEKGRTF